MEDQIPHRLTYATKSALTVGGLTMFAAPLLVGVMMSTPRILKAQSSQVFDVASVKAHNPENRYGALPFMQGGRFRAAGVPLQFVIAFAYNLPFRGMQLSGGPDWIRSAEGVYDIEAEADAAGVKGLSPEDRANKMRLMLQALLADRFKLIMRREIKEQPVYILTVRKNGPKLQKSKLEEKDCDLPANHCHIGGAGQGRGIHVKAFSIPELVTSVSNFTDRPLIDRTGLTGLYDIDTEGWVPLRPRYLPPGQEPTQEDLDFADPMRPTLHMIFERLGLNMESGRAPVEIFVIDHVEKPSPN